MKVGRYNFVWNPSTEPKDEWTYGQRLGAFCLALVVAFLFGMWGGSVVHADTLPTSSCKHSLAWQRWNYTKAHYDVIQSIRQGAPERNKWSHPTTQTQCRDARWQAKMLRIAETKHWSHLRLQRQGVKWIIRRQFRHAGRGAVLRAWQVASCESNFRPYVKSSTGDVGVWQINQVHDLPDSFTESPELSTGWAWRASSHGSNFSPTWVCASHYHIS